MPKQVSHPVVEKAEVKEKLGPVDHVRMARYEDMVALLHILEDPETREHLNPAPEIPINWDDEGQVRRCCDELWRYCMNMEPRRRRKTKEPITDRQGNILYGCDLMETVKDPQTRKVIRDEDGNPVRRLKFFPLVALDKDNHVVSFVAIRCHGDPFFDRTRGVAGIERLIVDPRCRHQNIGTVTLATAIDFIFLLKENPIAPQPKDRFNEVRLWIDMVGRYWINQDLFIKKFGFKAIEGRYADYCKERCIQGAIFTNPDMWLSLQRYEYEAVLQAQNAIPKQKRIKACDNVVIDKPQLGHQE